MIISPYLSVFIGPF